MKRLTLAMIMMILAAGGIYLIGADHVDAPAVGSLATGSTAADITDFYAFESPDNADNYVFVCNVLGLTAPSATGDASFDEDVMYEFNIDNNGDNVEDLVIQAIFRDGKVIAFGPTAPTETGLSSQVATDGARVEAEVTAYGTDPSVGESQGIRVFAGPRDDPFFMDFFKFVDIVNGAGASLGIDVPDPANGSAYATSFDSPGTDAFAGTNVLSVVIEVPKSQLGGGDSFASWLEAKRKI